MKDKLIELYKSVTRSDKTVVKNISSNYYDTDEIYQSALGFEMRNGDQNIFAETAIISSTKTS